MAVIYECDRCFESTPDNSERFLVRIDVRKLSDSYTSPSAQKLFCQKCLEEIGLKKWNEFSGAEKPDPEPTFEDMIREIAQQVLEENTET